MPPFLPKLGALPAITRPGQPALSSLHMMVRTAPPVLDRRHINPDPIMGRNDTIGDCTSVGLANSIRALSVLNKFHTAISDDDAVQFYSLSTGYDPNRPETDQGGVEVDVLAVAGAVGYRAQNQILHPIWGTISPQDLNGMRLAMAGMGTAYLGVQLAVADQAGIGKLWDTDTPDEAGDRTPGSWGGHCLLAWDYSGVGETDTVTLITWGATQKATWRWIRSRLMEAHGVLWPQLASPLPNFLSVADIESVKAANAAFLGW